MVTLALKFVVIYHARNFDFVFMSEYMYVDVLNYRTVGYTFDILLSGIYMHLNCKLEYSRHIHANVEIYDGKRHSYS